MKYFLIVFLMVSANLAFAQNSEKKQIIQFSGVVYDADSNTVVPYVTIKNLTSKKVYASNYKGYFSFVAQEGDSITFNSIGYKLFDLVIPKTGAEKKYTQLIRIKTDNIMLPMVRVFPWASVEDFKKDFLAMKLADDDLAIAKKNIENLDFNALYQSLPRDGTEVRSTELNNRHSNLTNRTGVQNNPLLNPLAWASLIKQITEGQKKKDKN